MNPAMQRLQNAVEGAIRGITPEELSRRPQTQGSWSVAEVLEHLYLTYTGTVKGCGRCLEVGKPIASARTRKGILARAIVISVGYFPSGRKSPKQAEPRGMDSAKVAADIAQQIARMDEMIAQCEARYGNSVLLDHPILGPLNGKQWRKFHWVHGRHHVKQILRLRHLIHKLS